MLKYIKDTLLNSGFVLLNLDEITNIAQYRYHSPEFTLLINGDSEDTENTNVFINLTIPEKEVYVEMNIKNSDFNLDFINKVLSLFDVEIEFEEPDNVFLTPDYLIERGFKWFEYKDNSTNKKYGECSLVTDEMSVVVRFNFYISYSIYNDDFFMEMTDIEKLRIDDFMKQLNDCNIII